MKNVYRTLKGGIANKNINTEDENYKKSLTNFFSCQNFYMKKIIIISLGILAIAWIVLQASFPLKRESIIGTYVNTNFSNEHCCVEAPHKPDTLILYSNGKFTSDYYGNGSFVLNGSNIHLEYQYEMGTAGYSTYLTNKLFEEPRIILNYDLNHYYRKIG